MPAHHKHVLIPGPPKDSSSRTYWSWQKHLWQQVLNKMSYMRMIFNNFRLFNISQYNWNEALCSKSEWTRDENGEYVHSAHRFKVGHGADAATTNISWMVGHYLGDAANPCITVIDTPGTGDTEGRDCEHGIALTEEIKQMGSIAPLYFSTRAPAQGSPSQWRTRSSSTWASLDRKYGKTLSLSLHSGDTTKGAFVKGHIFGVAWTKSLSTTDGTRITEKDLKSSSQYHQFSLIQCMMKNMQTTKKKRSMRKILTSSGICSPMTSPSFKIENWKFQNLSMWQKM